MNKTVPVILKPISVNLLLSFLLLGTIFFSQKSRLFLPFTENEGVFTCVAQEMSFGAKLYQDVWDHKPPLLFLHFLFIQKFLKVDELDVHLYVLFIHCLNAFLIYLLTRKLNLNQVGAWTSTFCYGILISPSLLQPWSAQADLLMQPFLMISFIFAFSKNSLPLFLAGVFWAIAFFTKQSALFFLPLYLFLFGVKNLNKFALFVLGVDLITVFVAAPFFIDGRMSEFWSAVTGFNGAYVQNGWELLLTQKLIRDYIFTWNKAFLLIYGLPLIGSIEPVA